MFAVKLALKLNNREATLMAKHAGLRRVVFNMGLSLRTQMYGKGQLSDSKVINEIKKVLTNHVKKKPRFAGMNLLSSRDYQNALIDLKDAFSRYRSAQVIPLLLFVEMVNRVQWMSQRSRFYLVLVTQLRFLR
jgi:putative transposase